ncbi:small membrane protein YoaI [Shigella flexneri]
MNDQMFVETLIITSSFFRHCRRVVLSVPLIERTGELTQCGGN